MDKIINTNRFVADKGFSGTDASGAPRSGPVQFEREDEDIFGLGELLQTNTTKKVNLKKYLQNNYIIFFNILE